MNLNDPSVMDKSMRSVFVGNIPYEATEEKLKDIFSEVGPVTSFKLVYDRETGKPKGYGFCEYKDQETALSAMRNLNSREIAGRTLRVDNACTEKSRMEMQTLMAGPVVEDSPYGAAVEPMRAPETIGKAVASLPPEQMFQLMQQMKLCIQNNPQEARTMLLQNPQLAYALLQAQVVMRIVDPETAVTMLHKTTPSVTPLGAPSRGPPPMSAPSSMASLPMMPQVGGLGGPLPVPPPGPGFNPGNRPPSMDHGGPNRPPMDHGGPNRPPSMDHGGQNRPPMDHGGPKGFPEDDRGPPPDRRDPRNRGDRGPGPARNSEPRVDPRGPMRGPPQDNRGPPPQENRGPQRPPMGGPPPGGDRRGPPPGPGAGGQAPRLPDHLAGADPEKAQLIMQVLQLTDEQISMLPPEQRQSILVLKEQINQGR